jgi:hypothetical protein
MPSIACSSAVAITQPVQAGTWPGHPYPQMIIKAIKESVNGQLKVPELYRKLSDYDSTLISKLIPMEPMKNKKQKTAEEIFKENVRQNLSRKSMFRNIKDAETGKSTGYWELAEGES